MVEIKDEELVEEKETSEPTEAEKQSKGAMEVTEEVVQFQKEKEQIEKEKEQEQDEEKVESKPKTKPVKKEIDLTHFNAFKEKITKEFGLTSKVDGAGHHLMYYKDFLVVKLLPRKNWWFGICREVPEQDNIWKAFRIHNEEEIKPHYEHIKKFIEVNKQEE